MMRGEFSGYSDSEDDDAVKPPKVERIELEPVLPTPEIPSPGGRYYVDEQRRIKAIMDSYLMSSGPRLYDDLLRQLPKPVDGNLPDDSPELAARTEQGLATEAQEIRNWFDATIEGRLGIEELTQLIATDDISHVIILSHGRFTQKDAVVIAEESEECEARVRATIDAFGRSWKSSTQPPLLVLAGATQQLPLMKEYATENNPRQHYNLPDWVPYGLPLRDLDCQPFPDCNTKTQFEAINAMANAGDYKGFDKKIAILTSDYHVARCLLYVYRWLDPSVRERVVLIGKTWAFDPNRMDDTTRTELLNAEKERCVLYGTRKPDGQRGDLARPWEA